MASIPDAHVLVVLNSIRAGRLVPFLGAGVNRCGRPSGAQWGVGEYLPDGRELARKLAADFGFDQSGNDDLLRVAEFVAVTAGTGPLRDSLHDIFAGNYPITPVHQFFARLPGVLRQLGGRQPPQLLITTNYDDMVESAFREAGEPLDVLTYIAEGTAQGRFVHETADGKVSVPIEKPNEYTDLPIDPKSQALQRSLLVKVHGAIHRADPEQDSYVITEDHYIDYLTRSNLRTLIPSALVGKLTGCAFLFMGYGLRDWNLRALLRQVWREQKFKYTSWAIQLNPDLLEQKFWQQRNVEIIDTPLEEYITLLEERLRQLVVSSGAAPTVAPAST
jgi:hypothetical protein